MIHSGHTHTPSHTLSVILLSCLATLPNKSLSTPYLFYLFIFLLFDPLDFTRDACMGLAVSLPAVV